MLGERGSAHPACTGEPAGPARTSKSSGRAIQTVRTATRPDVPVDAQDTAALVVDLRGQVSHRHLEHRQIVAWCLHGLDQFRRLASPRCSVIRATRMAEDGLQPLQIERSTGAVDELLIHLVHRRSAPEQQVATQLQLKHRIPIGETAVPLFRAGEGEDETDGVDPALAHLAQAPDCMGSMHYCIIVLTEVPTVCRIAPETRGRPGARTGSRNPTPPNPTAVTTELSGGETHE